MGHTTIQITEDIADELHDRKQRGDSYNDVIRRLIQSDHTDTQTDATAVNA